MVMKCMVLVPGVEVVPYARWWISAELEACHRCPLLLQLNLVYLASSPVSGLKALPCSAQWGAMLTVRAGRVAVWA